jgi:hypothetical protein
MAAWGGLLLCFTLWFGFPGANVAFGLMISIHAMGLVYYCSPLMAQESFRCRLGFTLLMLIAVLGALYWPARDRIQGHWLTPVRRNGQVIVVRRTSQASTVHRGDWVAYTLEGYHAGDAHAGGAVWIRGGSCLEPVLAVAGDRVVFSSRQFSVNDVSQPARPYMPAKGEFLVPADHWFIWPNVAISQHGGGFGPSITSAMMGMADVWTGQLWGKPLRHWFWRKQTLPGGAIPP